MITIDKDHHLVLTSNDFPDTFYTQPTPFPTVHLLENEVDEQFKIVVNFNKHRRRCVFREDDGENSFVINMKTPNGNVPFLYLYLDPKKGSKNNSNVWTFQAEVSDIVYSETPLVFPLEATTITEPEKFSGFLITKLEVTIPYSVFNSFVMSPHLP